MTEEQIIAVSNLTKAEMAYKILGEMQGFESPALDVFRQLSNVIVDLKQIVSDHDEQDSHE